MGQISSEIDRSVNKRQHLLFTCSYYILRVRQRVPTRGILNLSPVSSRKYFSCYGFNVLLCVDRFLALRGKGSLDRLSNSLPDSSAKSQRKMCVFPEWLFLLPANNNLNNRPLWKRCSSRVYVCMRVLFCISLKFSLPGRRSRSHPVATEFSLDVDRDAKGCRYVPT